MKRISLWMAILALTPGITHAFYQRVRLSHRIRYSPYALEYGSSGLVPGGLEYSAHASGLVYEGSRYTPYAFDYGRSGLIVDYALWYGLQRPAPHYVVSRRCPNVPQTPRTGYTRRTYHSRSTSRQAKAEDGMQVIRRYLDARGFQNIRINRILRVDNKLISADIIVADQDLVVKYWDPKEIKALEAKADCKRKMFERYRQKWDRFADEHLRGDGEIYHVRASDKKDIVAALDACDGLKSDGDLLQTATMYARH